MVGSRAQVVVPMNQIVCHRLNLWFQPKYQGRGRRGSPQQTGVRELLGIAPPQHYNDALVSGSMC
jgi:hypothetical protein